MLDRGLYNFSCSLINSINEQLPGRLNPISFTVKRRFTSMTVPDTFSCLQVSIDNNIGISRQAFSQSHAICQTRSKPELLQKRQPRNALQLIWSQFPLKRRGDFDI